jgi:hypothetical protein
LGAERRGLLRVVDVEICATAKWRRALETPDYLRCHARHDELFEVDAIKGPCG